MRSGRTGIGLLLIGAVAFGCARGTPGGLPPGSPRPTPTRAPGSARPPGTPTPPPSTAPGDAVVTLEGPIEAVLPGGYRIAGHPVRVPAEADSEGPLPPGVYVTVIGVRAPDGSVTAEALEVLRRPGAEIEWEGAIQEVLPGGYRVDGRRVFVLSTTAVMGELQAGQEVYVAGFEQPDGSIVADTLIPLEAP